ncbi:MAG: hypothetical protein ACRDP4_05670 [Nocardioidaceae bacterium]
MIHTYEITEFLSEMSPETEQAWLVWCARMAVDLQRVICPGRIEADDEARQVRYLTWTPDADHKPQLDPKVSGRLLCHLEVVQLEAAPLPMPTEEDE